MPADGKEENYYLIEPEGYGKTKQIKLECIDHHQFWRVNGISLEKYRALPQYSKIRAIARAYGYPFPAAIFNGEKMNESVRNFF